MEAQTPGEAVSSPEATMVEVQEALESMLSKKSLVRDQFLAGNMNPQMYIPIMTLLQHEKLQAVGATEAAVIAAAIRSTKLGVDEKQTMVKPLLKSKRNVVILREVPEGTTEADIFELFVGAPHADRIVHVKPEVNNTWFVKFDLDEGTQDVVLWLRSQQLKGQPVNAAIKSEHFLRSFYPMAGQGRPPMCFPQTEQRSPLELLSASMPMPMPPALPQEGLQCAGYWQPWGAHHQPQPLIFNSPTTLAASSMPKVGQQDPPLEFLDDIEDVEGSGGKGAKDSRGGDYKGDTKGKGKWRSGKEWSGKDSSSKGGYGNGKDWNAGGKDWNAGGKDWHASGKEWYAGSKDGYGGGKAGYAGRDAYAGKDWYAASSGKGGGVAHWVPTAERETRRKGGKSEKGDATVAGSSGEFRKRLATGKGQQKGGGGVPAGNRFASMGSVYEHDVRKYTREDFEHIRKAVTKEHLSRPEALVEALGGDLPVLREVPVLDSILP